MGNRYPSFYHAIVQRVIVEDRKKKARAKEERHI